jgi:hypothetical protein
MKSMSANSNLQTALSLYLVSFDDWDYGQHDSFLVAACNVAEAAQLTPDPTMNRYLGAYDRYDYPSTEDDVTYYRELCNRNKSVRRVGDAWLGLQWGDVPIASYKAG